MKNGSMFAFLETTRDRAYYAAHPRLYLLTPPRGTYRLDLVAGYTDEAGGEGFRTAFLDEAAFLAFVERARARSDFASPVEVLPGDRLVTLATCTYTFENARYLLLCRLTRSAERRARFPPPCRQAGPLPPSARGVSFANRSGALICGARPALRQSRARVFPRAAEKSAGKGVDKSYII